MAQSATGSLVTDATLNLQKSSGIHAMMGQGCLVAKGRYTQYKVGSHKVTADWSIFFLAL